MLIYVDSDWDKEFAVVDFEIEAIWNILYTKIDDGMKQFIPITSRFHSTKWKRPLKEEIRQQIRL